MNSRCTWQVAPTPMNNNTNNKQRNGRNSIPRSQPKVRNQKKKEKAKVIYYAPAPTLTGKNADCLLEFAAIRADPFHNLEALPCNPVYDEGFSTKRKIYSRHTFNAGTKGNGFFVVNCRLGVKPTSGFQIYHTTADFEGEGIILNGPALTGVKGEDPVFPYSTTSEPAPIGWKLVALGIKVRSTGPYLNTAGMIYRLAMPMNVQQGILKAEDIAAGVNYPWMANRHGGVYQVNFMTKDQSIDDQYGTQKDNPSKQFTHGFYVAGCVPNYSFTAEVVQYWEYKFGVSTPSDATPSPAIQEARGVCSQLSDETIGKNDFSENSVKKTLTDLGRTLIEGAGGMASDYVTNWFRSHGFRNVPRAIKHQAAPMQGRSRVIELD